MDSERRVAVVTGSSAGIGRATAVAFGRRGWRVALLARGEDGLEGARRDVERGGGEALALPTDVSRHDQVEAAAAAVAERWGAIDVWVNNAMATLFCEFRDTEPEDFRRALEVTYLGTVWGTRMALRSMLPRNRGVIVQVGSALAYRSIPLQSAYCGAKSAIRGFTDSLRSELIHQRSAVRLTMVQLSAFNTPQFDWCRSCIDRELRPLGKVFQPEVAAEAIFWAATHRRREVWVGWPAVQAILGTRLVPGLLDHLLARRGYDGQMTGGLRPRPHPDNLFEPLAGDRGAHGRFDAEALASSLQWRLGSRRPQLLIAAAALLLLLAWLAG
jgi:NAD(P)-dependent dehydrogenase (short-subunit alcohol dehydrogenase family)